MDFITIGIIAAAAFAVYWYWPKISGLFKSDAG